MFPGKAKGADGRAFNNSCLLNHSLKFRAEGEIPIGFVRDMTQISAPGYIYSQDEEPEIGAGSESESRQYGTACGAACGEGSILWVSETEGIEKFAVIRFIP